jgi:hypothetical protein
MAPGWIHTRYLEGHWVNEVEGSEPAPDRHLTKYEAVTRGHALAQRAHTDQVIHNVDGSTAAQRRYHSDPYAPAGRYVAKERM